MKFCHFISLWTLLVGLGNLYHLSSLCTVKPQSCIMKSLAVYDSTCNEASVIHITLLYGLYVISSMRSVT